MNYSFLVLNNKTIFVLFHDIGMSR